MHVHDLRTPAVLVEFARLRANLDRMQALATRHGLRLRPHAKTHKNPQIARWQLDAGAVGICCAKLGEAEVFADAGVEDIRLPYPLHPSNADRVFALIDRGVRLSFVVDREDVAREWSAAAQSARRLIDVLIKVDVGFHRCGIDPRHPDAGAVVAKIAGLPGLRLRGLLSHAGHAYAAASDEALAAIVAEEARLLHETAEAARARGVTLDELSVGSTPTARFAGTVAGLTEMRPGNYVYNDRTQVALGSARLDECALTVLSTVVSAHGDRVILDAGSKTLTTDQVARAGFPGFGAIFRSAAADALQPHLFIERLSEEHATVRVTGGDGDTGSHAAPGHAAPGHATGGRADSGGLRPGDRVRILPNHACVVSNLADEIALVSGTHVIDHVPIAARGRNT